MGTIDNERHSTYLMFLTQNLWNIVTKGTMVL